MIILGQWWIVVLKNWLNCPPAAAGVHWCQYGSTVGSPALHIYIGSSPHSQWALITTQYVEVRSSASESIFSFVLARAHYFANMSIDRQTCRQWLLSALCLCLYPNCQPLSMLEIKLTFLIGPPHKIRTRYCAQEKGTSLYEVASCELVLLTVCKYFPNDLSNWTTTSWTGLVFIDFRETIWLNRSHWRTDWSARQSLA